MARCLHCESKNLRIKDEGLMEVKITSSAPIVMQMNIYVCEDCGNLSIW